MIVNIPTWSRVDTAIPSPIENDLKLTVINDNKVLASLMEKLNYKTLYNYLSLIYKNRSTQEIGEICKAIKEIHFQGLNKDISNEK